jgi:hypothetical protein
MEILGNEADELIEGDCAVSVNICPVYDFVKHKVIHVNAKAVQYCLEFLAKWHSTSLVTDPLPSLSNTVKASRSSSISDSVKYAIYFVYLNLNVRRSFHPGDPADRCYPG